MAEEPKNVKFAGISFCLTNGVDIFVAFFAWTKI